MLREHGIFKQGDHPLSDDELKGVERVNARAALRSALGDPTSKRVLDIKSFIEAAYSEDYVLVSASDMCQLAQMSKDNYEQDFSTVRSVESFSKLKGGNSFSPEMLISVPREIDPRRFVFETTSLKAAINDASNRVKNYGHLLDLLILLCTSYYLFDSSEGQDNSAIKGLLLCFTILALTNLTVYSGAHKKLVKVSALCSRAQADVAALQLVGIDENSSLYDLENKLAKVEQHTKDTMRVERGETLPVSFVTPESLAVSRLDNGIDATAKIVALLPGMIEKFDVSWDVSFLEDKLLTVYCYLTEKKGSSFFSPSFDVSIMNRTCDNPNEGFVTQYSGSTHAHRDLQRLLRKYQWGITNKQALDELPKGFEMTRERALLMENTRRVFRAMSERS